jgi:flagellar hook-associated protein 3 FlgL
MTRVSENSSKHSIKHSLNRTKKKLEDLQLKGATLKGMTRPSDNPIGNIEALSLQSRISDNNQYTKNANYAQLHLNATETSVSQLLEIVNKAKELAISQSSDFYDEDIRKNVSHEVEQLRNQALSIANKRIGQKYLFGGFKTLSKPFNDDGTYVGDKGQINLEVSKDFFVPINLNGAEVFYATGESSSKKANPFELIKPSDAKPTEMMDDKDAIDKIKINTGPGRDLASVNSGNSFNKVQNIFSQLDSLAVGMRNNDTTLIQSLLEKLDQSASRLITQQTKIGSIDKSISNSKNLNEDNKIDAQARKSELTDADVTELYSDLVREQDILKATYQASQTLMNKSLMDFLR